MHCGWPRTPSPADNRALPSRNLVHPRQRRRCRQIARHIGIPLERTPRIHGGARKAALIFIFITVLIDVLAFGVIIPVLPHLVQEFVGGDTSTAAYWTGAFAFAFSLVQFFSAPIQGALADRYGRRPVILISCLGLAWTSCSWRWRRTWPGCSSAGSSRR
jgi:hypothetical protein